ncbi:RtcB family protein [Telluribacter sp. SYSU D00476]|uniref:RtcB family protein n=1 Tax=Telluribacter sp. SYSU D00476 TaxID=2811430 RepID=UPI001FF6C8D5|nr:RtcB family protein [Telluribacter sp. SYSU D00476]
MKNLTIFGKEIIDENSIRQIQNCLSDEDIGVLTADAHYGYGHPIGGAVAYKNKISLSGVGFDIACGNKAVRTNLQVKDIKIPRVMDEIFRRISFGVGRPNNEPVDHPVLEKIAHAEFKPQRKFYKDLAKPQLGTVGSGNHFIDLFEDEEGYLWIGVHFGSRGFGHRTTTGFIALSQGMSFTDMGKEGSMDSPPILFDLDSEIGQDYIEAMNLAGEYAYAGRDAVVDKVLEILDHPEVTFSVHNHHNFAWKEEHFGETYWVVRKGCTPAFPGQLGFIGATMADTSVIIEGVDSEESKKALYSTVHGAGRVMSRTQAAGKMKWMRDKNGVKRPTVITQGKVNFTAVKEYMTQAGIELRGAGPDEAPECYKKLEEVLGYMGDTIRVLHRLRPVGVAMAGMEVYDPYKD